MSGTRHLLHVFSTFGRGGPQVRTAQLMSRMPRGWRHSLMAMDGEDECRDQVDRGIEIEILAPPTGGFLRVARSQAELIRSVSPDLVLTYNWGAIETVLGARLAGHRGLVHHEEGFGGDEVVRRHRRRNWIRRWLLRRCVVIVPSATLLGIARREWGVPAKLLHHLPNGVDLQRFVPGRGVRGAGESVVIGHVGGLRPEKNQALLLRALACMKNRDRCRLEVVGDGPERPGLEALGSELGLAGNVAFLGERLDTAGVYPGWDVFALSSHTEQMPISVLEAMACGLPVVSTAVGDMAEMLGEESSQLLVAAQPEALAGALDRLVERPELRAELGEANRRRCEARYELEASLSRYLEVYNEVLNLSTPVSGD